VVLDAVTLKQLYTVYPQSRGHSWENVVFSSDSHLLSGFSWDYDCIVTWDLQTGGVIGDISTEEAGCCNSMSFSECGTMLGGVFDQKTITTYNILSNTCISSHPIQGPAVDTIWTCGEYLQFATVDSGSIIIWQVSFTSGHTPTKVGSLSTPEGFSKSLAMLPTLSWLAFIDKGRVVLWDAQHHKVLLDSVDAENPVTMSFSADGQLIICGTGGKESYLWKKSHSSYISKLRKVW
jgi:hypothetical protein